jgi:hypothetical protein
MTISRITTWVDGQVLTAAALNNEFDNLIGNATSLISPLTGNLDFNLNQATNLVLENRAAGPSVTTNGRIYFDTVYNTIRVGSTVAAGYIPPFEAIGRPVGLQGSLISNIGSFAAEMYAMALVGTQQGISITATSSFSVNTQTAGPIAGGRDQAGAFASTDVHFYAVVNNIRSTVVYGVCSSKPPSAFAASGFPYWAYLGSAKYNVTASAVTQPWIVRGSRIHPKSSQGELLNIIFDTSERLAVTTTAVPTIATQIDLTVNYGVEATVGGVNAISSFRIASESSPTGGYPIVWHGSVGGLNGYSYNAQSLTLPNTGLVAALTVMSTGQGGLGLMLNSYTVPNGDN